MQTKDGAASLMSGVLSGDTPFLRTGEGALIDLGDHRGRVLVSAQQSGGSLLLVDVEVDPLGGPPPHMHTREDEIFHILDGRFEFRIGEATFQAGPGDTVLGPRQVPHAWRCFSERPGRLLGLVTPGANFERFATTMRPCGFDPVAMSEDPALAAAFAGFAAEFGLVLLPPPGLP